MSKIYKINNHLMKYKSNCINAKGVIPTITGVQIENYIWSTENLAFDDGGEGITIIDNVSANGVNMGTQYYYTWEAAVRVANKINGWHLPTLTEIQDWWNYPDRSMRKNNPMKSTTGWTLYNGTNQSQFNAYPVGTWFPGTQLYEVGNRMWFWLNEIYNNNEPYSVSIDDYSIMYGHYTWDTLSYGSRYSVRLVKD